MIIIEQTARDAIQEVLTKQDLLEIISTLGIEDVDITQRYSKLVDIIVTDCDNNGVPEWQDCPKLLRTFFITAGITDTSGEVIVVSTNADSPNQAVSDVEIEYPECYGLADKLDPACGRCKVVDQCLIKHKESLPPCYGKSYSADAPECKICIEKVTCSKETK